MGHVSCLVEQAKILMDEGEANNLDNKAMQLRWDRWYKCGLCKQNYHSDVYCALGWACWKTYLGRPEADSNRILALRILGNGFAHTGQDQESLGAHEACLASQLRRGSPGLQPGLDILVTKSNIANCLGKL